VKRGVPLRNEIRLPGNPNSIGLGMTKHGKRRIGL
jgi:hypothetical protein